MASRLPVPLIPSPGGPDLFDDPVVELRPVPELAPPLTDPAPEPIEVVADRDVAVQIEGYGRSFDGRTVVQGVDLTIRDAEVVALLGASGSGKSTLLRALAGLDPGADGRVLVPRARSVVFQDHRLLPWRRVWRNVLIGLPTATRADAVAALAEVGLADHADAWPATLSGGESQRVALARAFIRSPRLLLLDEPFGALDALTRLKMHALLRTLFAKHSPATLIVTHDVDEAIALADRVLVLKGGRVAYDERIELGAERDRGGPGVIELRAKLLQELGV